MNTYKMPNNNNNINNNSNNMVHEILYEQDLSRAGELFSISSDVLLQDFATTIDIIKSIVDNKKYVNQLNEQSIVEIVLTRCISALRDTKIITNYYEELLDLLEICLKYNLYKNDDSKANTPHANIVSDIFSCILLDYLDLSLSKRAIPICIRLLQQCSKELSREICSYLNLIACRDPRLLINYVDYMVDAILKGNNNLCRLLYQLCETDIECIYPLTKHLIRALKIIDSNQVMHLLQIMHLISLNHVHLIIVHLDDIIEYLVDDNYRDIVLDIMFSIANQVPIAIEPYLSLFEKSTYYDDVYKVPRIISTVGRSLKSKSEYCTNLLIKRIDNTDKTIHIIKEIYEIAVVHPNVLDTCYHTICDRCENPSSNVKQAIEQLHKLKSSSILSGGNSSSIILHTNNHSSYNNSVDSIENYANNSNNHNKQNQTRNSSNDNLNYKSKEKLSNMSLISSISPSSTNNLNTNTTLMNENTKSFILNATSIHNSVILPANELTINSTLNSNSLCALTPVATTTLAQTVEVTPQVIKTTTPIMLTTSCEVVKLSSPSYVIKEDDENVLNNFDKDLNEIEKHFDKNVNLIVNGDVEGKNDDDDDICNDSDSPRKNKNVTFNVVDQVYEKDVVQQFCEKHLDKIRNYIKNIMEILPLPVECSIDEKGSHKAPKKKAKYLNLNFTCFLKGQYCLFDRNYFEIKTNQAALWIHLIFLSSQSKWSHALTQKDQTVIDLKTCYNCFKCSDKLQFVPLLTSSFPNEKQQKVLLNELNDMRFFDLFEFNKEHSQWFCYLCSNPQKAHDLLNESTLIQSQLKEKRGKWKFLKRWKKRIYSLTGGNIVYVKKDMRQESLSVRYIKSIQPVKSNRNIPKAFEIFTDTNSFILKAKNSADAEQWLQYLQISKAHEMSRCNLNDSTIYKTCL